MTILLYYDCMAYHIIPTAMMMYPDSANITTKQGGQRRDDSPVRQQRDNIATQIPAAVHMKTSNDRDVTTISGKYTVLN